MEQKSDQHDALMYRYVEICNAAMKENCERFPFKQILGAAEKLERGVMIEVVIEGSDPELKYAMMLSRGGLVATPHELCSDCECDRKWFVSADYLQQVADNPGSYISNPAKLDWEWIMEPHDEDATTH